MKTISILGSTGSVGSQALEVCRELKTKVIALSANTNITLLERQIREFRPKYVSVFNEDFASKLKGNLKDIDIKILSGMEGLCEVASLEGCDVVLNSLIGMVGLKPTIKAIESGIDVALANKETLVAGGMVVKNFLKKSKAKIIPVDSEHSAIFQCLEGNRDKKILKRIILTASGGPFWEKLESELENVTISEALNHPNWKMGSKITIDSATMMNKGLEIIEAVHLFDIDETKIEVLVHRESIVHSMVEFIDSSIIAQLAVPDMKLPIQYALVYPDRAEAIIENLDLTKKPLTFQKPKKMLSKCMNLCRKAVKEGGASTTILNAANEEAVSLFLDGKIKFIEIEQIVENAMNSISSFQVSSVDDVVSCDLKTRKYVRELL